MEGYRHTQFHFWPLDKEEEILFAVRLWISLKEWLTCSNSTRTTKRLNARELSPWRTHRSKSTKHAKLKDQDDRDKEVASCPWRTSRIITKMWYGLRSILKRSPWFQRQGVKAITKDGDQAAAAWSTTPSMYILTQRGKVSNGCYKTIPVTSHKRDYRFCERKINHTASQGRSSLHWPGDFDSFYEPRRSEDRARSNSDHLITKQVMKLIWHTTFLKERYRSFVNDTISIKKSFSATIK